MKVVVVESPAKAKTINKYLGKGYEVLASFGHIRDLPPKDGSVDPDHDFAMQWEVDGKASKRVSEIANTVKGSDGLILATDPDREGEAISWHVLEVLKEKDALKDHKIERVVFNAITKQSVSEAMKHPRDVDSDLVEAYLARRALDFLALSFSALDYVGHRFGPRSHEVQDTLVRLDRTIGRLLDHLDRAVGRDRYVVALSSDHGVAPLAEQMQEAGIAAGTRVRRGQTIATMGRSSTTTTSTLPLTSMRTSLNSPSANKPRMAAVPFSSV